MVNHEFENLDQSLFEALSEDEMNKVTGGIQYGGGTYTVVCSPYHCEAVLVDAFA